MSNSSLVALNDNILDFLQRKELGDVSAIRISKNNLKITDSNQLQKELEELSNTDRLLRIGIIGRVKAGKSSLLNALVFDGKDILPKAATPMTAALTRMEYSENVRAEVEFYDQQDLKDIEEKSRRYSEKFQLAKDTYKSELEKENKENSDWSRLKGSAHPKYTPEQIEKKAEEYAKGRIERDVELSSAHDQHQRIRDSNITLEELSRHSTIEADTTADLMGLLNNYVGSSGKYMPFTKSVKLYIPEEGLKGLEVVDTPGVNDPVQSREQRTNEFLTMCDVVLVVSPSGQFLSEEDMQLMARVDSRAGIQKIYIVASQIDNQLFGSEKQEGCSPLKVLNNLEKKLDGQAKQILSNYHNLNAEVIELYKQHNIICTSSVAYGLHKHFDNQSEWDKNMQHVWGNLKRNYPDSFSDPETAKITLEKLGDISKIRQILIDVQNEKEQIQANRLNKFTHSKQKSLNEFIEVIKKYIVDHIDDLKSRDTETEKSQYSDMKSKYDDFNETIKAVYRKSIRDLDRNIGLKLHKTLDDMTSDFDEKNQTEEHTYTMSSEINDNDWTNFWGLLGYRTRTISELISEETVNAGQIKSTIRKIQKNILHDLKEVANKEQEAWEDALVHDIFSGMREVNEQSSSPQRLMRGQINGIIQNVLLDIPKVSFELKSKLPPEVNRSGTLKDEDARDFTAAAESYVHEELIPSAKNNIDEYISTAQANLTNHDIAKDILGKLDGDMTKLIQEIESREASIEKYNHMLKELKKLGE